MRIKTGGSEGLQRSEDLERVIRMEGGKAKIVDPNAKPLP
jgi:hypothetical protein